MSISVRLIGGQRNGQVVKVDHNQMQVVTTKSKPAMVAYTDRFGIGDSQVEVIRETYTRRVVSTPDGGVIYFALETMSDLESLQHVLGP